VTIAREGPELEGRSPLTFLQLGDTRFLEGVESGAVLGVVAATRVEREAARGARRTI
jgi:hypothetical protein